MDKGHGKINKIKPKNDSYLWAAFYQEHSPLNSKGSLPKYRILNARTRNKPSSKHYIGCDFENYLLGF